MSNYEPPQSLPQTSSPWRRRARRAIRNAIQILAPSTSPDELREAINRDYYPFGERENTPYKQWLIAINEFFPKQLEAEPMARIIFRPKEGVPPDYLPFLWSMITDPEDEMPRLVFSDYLAEREDDNAEGVRLPEVEEDAVARRAFGRGATIVISRGTYKREVVRWGKSVCNAQLITDHIRGKDLLLRDPDILRAVNYERTLAALRLFGTAHDRKPKKTKESQDAGNQEQAHRQRRIEEAGAPA